MNKQKQKINKDFNITKFNFLRDLLLIKAIRQGGVNGLINPESYEESPEFGIVIKLGSEVKDIKVGDVARFGKYSSEKIRNNGEDYFIVHAEDISAIQ